MSDFLFTLLQYTLLLVELVGIPLLLVSYLIDECVLTPTKRRGGTALSRAVKARK